MFFLSLGWAGGVVACLTVVGLSRSSKLDLYTMTTIPALRSAAGGSPSAAMMRRMIATTTTTATMTRRAGQLGGWTTSRQQQQQKRLVSSLGNDTQQKVGDLC